MYILTLASRPVLLADLFLRSFLPWYYMDKPQAIVRNYVRYFVVLAEIFSIPFLVRTLLSPWKNILAEYPAEGIQIVPILEAFSLNTVTRLIGATIRLATIIIGIAVQLLCFGLFAGYLLAWYAFPAIIIFALYSILIAMT